ncbi:MAG: hypothetical protein ACJ74E_02150 [Actinomycetes bacterium]
MRKSLAFLAATTVAGFVLALSACQSAADENGFLKHAERAFDRGKGKSVADEQWWQANQDRVLSAGWASCEWLEAQAEFDDEYQGPEQWMLKQQYLQEKDTIKALGGDPRFNRTLIDYAWAYLCIDTRNSRTALPPGAYEE